MAVRRFSGLLVIIAVTGVVAALGLVVRVPQDTKVVLTWRGGGTPTLLAPGFRLRVPFLQRIHRYENGVVRVNGTIRASSREGSEVSLPFGVSVTPDDEELLSMHRDGGPGGAGSALLEIVSDHLTEAARGYGTFELASGDALAAFEGRTGKWLQERFGSTARLSLDPALLPDEVRATFDREAIFGARGETGARVLLVGIDGADWDLIDPMIAAGELPNLARLKRTGAWGRLRSSVPTLSPLLWTSIATGKTPDRHGINDFLVTDPKTGRRVPINSTFRRSRALWNILSEAGLQSDVVARWATWPAERILGHMISDRVAYSTFRFSSLEAGREAVYPPDYAATVESLRVVEEEVGYEQIARFANITREEFEEARRSRTGGGPGGVEWRESVNVLTRVFASTETYYRTAIDILKRRRESGVPASLFAVYFQGIDEVNHRFAHCAPPKINLCPGEDYRRFRGTVAAFYRYQDRILGEIMSLDPEANTIVMSDHGFSSGEGRPDDVKPFIEGKPGLWHDMRGIFIAVGPVFGKGEIPRVSLYDIAPTVLRVLGLPVPDDMVGEVLDDGLSPVFLEKYPIARVPSYEWLASADQGGGQDGPGGEAASRGEGQALEGAAEEEILRQLRQLGYIGGGDTVGEGASPAGGAVPGEVTAPGAGMDETGPIVTQRPPQGGGVPTLLYYVNLGGVYLSKRQYDLAEAEFRKALSIDPRSSQALSGLAIIYEGKGEPERALEIWRGVVELDEGDNLATFVKMAELYIRLGRPHDGLAYMGSLPGERGGGERSTIGRLVATGLLHAVAGQPEEAERSYLQALEVDPSSMLVMQELFGLYDMQGRAVELEPLLQRALRAKPGSGMHHNWLGLVFKRRGDMEEAEREFRTALEVSPDLTGAMANLGSIYMQQRRTAEAVAVLRQALERDRLNIESRANLIVALGLEGDVVAAKQVLEEAVEMGLRVPHFHNAMAYALHVNGRTEEALLAVDEALSIDPRQPDALRLQTEIEGGRALQDNPYR